MTDFITSADAARQLGYTVQHVRRLVRQGTLSGVKMGRDWVVQQSSVQELMALRENLSLPLEEIAP
jgi:excisionase family DNA binding protein